MYHLLRKCRRQVRLLRKDIQAYHDVSVVPWELPEEDKIIVRNYHKACSKIYYYEKTIHELKNKPKDIPVSYTNWKFLLTEGLVKNG